MNNPETDTIYVEGILRLGGYVSVFGRVYKPIGNVDAVWALYKGGIKIADVKIGGISHLNFGFGLTEEQHADNRSKIMLWVDGPFDESLFCENCGMELRR